MTFDLLCCHVPRGSLPARFYTLHNYMVLFLFSLKAKMLLKV